VRVAQAHFEQESCRRSSRRRPCSRCRQAALSEGLVDDVWALIGDADEKLVLKTLQGSVGRLLHVMLDMGVSGHVCCVVAVEWPQ